MAVWVSSEVRAPLDFESLRVRGCHLIDLALGFARINRSRGPSCWVYAVPGACGAEKHGCLRPGKGGMAKLGSDHPTTLDPRRWPS